ncbi:MAG TPA: NAD(P)/FAD-dependent oxidoreductase [Pelolinea sp.]|nr:NAD(P)/FAD-dependent oxidoreductase [Pelolinea sp.]
MKTVAVIGAGAGGMAAAYDLAKAGKKVTVFEKESTPGGLAAGFKEKSWDWSLEKYYHHWFMSDSAILSLIKEMGFENKVRFYRPQTVVYHKGDFYPLDSPVAALLFPGFSFLDKIRFGLVTVFLRYISAWQLLEKYTAHKWMKKYYGTRVYQTLFEPLLMGKFSSFYKDVNMAWFWARFKVRTPKLGTYVGGFQAFLDNFAEKLKEMGVNFRFDASVDLIAPSDGQKIAVKVNGEDLVFDQAIATLPPKVLARFAPSLNKGYLDKLDSLQSLGAVMLILSLKQKLSEKNYYWFNLPKSAGFPFLALVEHTNFLSPEFFGKEHLVYCGDYLESDHEYFSLTKEQLVEKFLPSLKSINSDFDSSWVKRTWLFRTSFAQPIPLVNHSGNIPSVQTPIPNLYFASISQVYPWDRGTNFAVKLGRETADLMNQTA